MNNVMLRDDMDVHKVEMPFIWLFAKFGAITKEWPSTLEYRERKYKFVSQEAMPREVIGNYAGHARYELIEKITPVTHREFGAFMEIVGTWMRIGNNPLTEELDAEMSDIVDALQTRCDCDDKRAVFIAQHGIAKLKTLNPETVAAPADPDDEEGN